MPTAQPKGFRNDRSSLSERGLARFEVRGLPDDRALLRLLARRLAEGSPEAAHIRATLTRTIDASPKRGGILAALRRSPLVGADLDLGRPHVAARPIDL